MDKTILIQNNHTCAKCHEDFIFYPEDVSWHEHGTYSAKTVNCPFCNQINIIKYQNAAGLYVNKDSRYYR